MPLSEEICKEIEKLSRDNQQNKILTYLTERIKDGTALPLDIFDYASKHVWPSKTEKTYVIHASVINKLGVAINNQDSVQFYQLAAKRGSSWGHRNYAMCLLNGSHGLEKSPINALKHAKEAVKIAKDITNEQHEHKFILYKALKENILLEEAIIVLIEYFEYQLNNFQLEKNGDLKNKIKYQLESIIKNFNEIIHELINDVEQNSKKQNYQERLASLQSILNSKADYDQFLQIKQSSYFLKGKLHIKSNENSQAWLAYCSVKNKKLPFYNEAISERRNLLKEEIKNIEWKVISSYMTRLGIDEIDNNNEKNSNVIEKKSSNFILPQDITFPINFNKSWRKEAEWFSSVDKISIDAEYEKRLAQLENLITAKNDEINLLDEMLKNKKEDMALIQKKQALNIELNKYFLLKEELNQKYKKYLPENRAVFRRHETESMFFNPSRSKKISEITKLANQIVDSRFKTDSDIVEPIELNGKSTRLLISAERVFQEAIIILSGNDSPKLGIPKVKEKPWTMGNDYNQYSGVTGFGPIERYKVGNTNIQSEHRTSPKRQRLGDSFLPDQGSYSRDIYPFLSRLAGDDPEDEKKLARFMIRYGQHHQPVTVEELKVIYSYADENDVDCFNQICFLLMEKEQAQWHSATEENFQLGMSVAQARCLTMIEGGFLSFKEAFMNNALFGVYSQQNIINNPKKVAKSCKYIDELYMVYLSNKKSHDYARFFKNNIRDKKSRSSILTREQAHQDLKQVYGGSSDTENEAYNTDLSP